MTDDKDHEYVPHIVFTRSTARIELREVKADLHQAHHDHTELLIERNNLLEALREVNARLVEVTKELDAANAMRYAWHVRATAHFDRLESCEAALTTARQSRKRLVSLVSRYNELIEIYNHEFDFVLDERESWKSRAKEAEAERNAALLKRLGDDRQSAREMEDDEQ